MTPGARDATAPARRWERWFVAATSFAVRRPGRTLALAVALALLSLASVVARLEIKSSNLDLLDPRLPEIVRFRDFARRFGTPNMLVVALEGGDRARRDSAAGRIAEAVRGAPGVARVMARLPFRDEVLASLGMPSTFGTRDGTVTYLFVQPADVESAATTLAPFVDVVLARVAALGLEREGVAVAYTGLPRYALDDRDVIRRDIARWSGLSFFGILALFAWAYRGLREPLLAMAVLAFAALVTAGLGAWIPGHLTLVSAFFFSILFGLGIDFGVHLLDGSEELVAAGRTRPASLIEAVRRLAPGLGTGAATTSLSFFVLGASGFRGFAELGWLAGAGVVIALACMLTVLPALLLVVPGERRVARGLADRRFGVRLARLQSPRVALALVVVALGCLARGLPRFADDYLALQPSDSEAVRVERRMVRDSDLAPQFAAFVVADAAAAADVAARLREEPLVATVRTLSDFDRLVAFGAQIPGEWEAFRALYVAGDGAQAVYAFPAGDLWNTEEREEFLAAMRRVDPAVTGMPVLAELFGRRARVALERTSILAGILLVVLVAADLKAPWRAALALLPTVLAVAAMAGLQRLLGLAWNPLNLLALPVVLGVSEDAGVHLVHRFVAEEGDLGRTLAGAGRAIAVSGATTLLGFGALIGAHHRGLASLARLLSLGVGLSLVFTLFVLPPLLRKARRLLLARGGT
jgi:predicted RND superfamily exporter protein